MNTTILQKAVDELNKDAPRLDYIRGLLETLIEIAPKPAPVVPSFQEKPVSKAIKLGPLTKE
jgi:hypothetical protein